MSCIVVYLSKHRGNTKKIAQVIAEELKCEAKSADGVKPGELDQYDIIGIGSGIYAFRMDGRLKKLLKGLKDPKSKGIFLFSTSADPDGTKYHKGMKKFVEKLGLKLLGEFNCQGLYEMWFFGKKSWNHGRPNEDDLKKAREFASSIVPSSR